REYPHPPPPTKKRTKRTINRVLMSNLYLSATSIVGPIRAARLVKVEHLRSDFQRRPREDEVAVFGPQMRAAPEKKLAQGKSLVKGDQPPRAWWNIKEREQERQ